MLPYYLLVFIPALVFLFQKMYQKNIFKEKKDDYKIVLIVYFTILIILLSLRNVKVGTDLINYRYYFNRYMNMTFKDILYFIFYNNSNDIEPGYIMFMWIVGLFTNNFQVFISVVALISVIPIACLYLEDSSHPFLKYILFMTATLFPMLFSGLRQIIAISIGVQAYRMVRKKKIIPFLLIVLVAFLFHRSAIILLALYPIYHININKYIAIVLFTVTFFLKRPLFELMKNLLFDKFKETTSADTGAYTMLILLILFSLFSYVIPDKNKFNNEALGLRNILILATLLQIFASLHATAMRMNYYFFIYIPILIPKILNTSRNRMKEVAALADYVMCSFFTLYYFFDAYTGADILKLYPYIPFWKG